jgi:hypothetical protein
MYRIVRAFERADVVDAVTVRGLGRMRNTSDEPWHDGWGVTYAGEAGQWLAMGHSTWLIAGILMSLLLRRRWRVVGVSLLAGWYALWGLNAVYLSAVRLMEVWFVLPHIVGMASSWALLVLLFLQGRRVGRRVQA